MTAQRVRRAVGTTAILTLILLLIGTAGPPIRKASNLPVRHRHVVLYAVDSHVAVENITCYASSCNYSTQYCSDGYKLQTVGDYYGFFEISLWWSPGCVANWASATGYPPAGASMYLQILSGSPAWNNETVYGVSAYQTVYTWMVDGSYWAQACGGLTGGNGDAVCTDQW